MALQTLEPTREPDEPGGEEEQRVAPLELFFDLVFVFAVTQVTALMVADTSLRGIGQGMLVLGALWWAWVGYAWLTNVANTDDLEVRLVMFLAMGALFVAALAAPGAFDEDGLVFGLAYFVVRLAHILLYAHAPNDVDVRGAVMRLAPTAILGSGLIVAASALDGVAQAGLWAVALLIDYAGGMRGRGRGWRVSPGHFAERHGLIVIIALGEVIVASGVGAEEEPLTVPVITAAVLAIAVSACLWWAYFDVVEIVAERRLRRARGAERSRLARDSYSYLHLPMVAGIVLIALGLENVLAHVDEPLETLPAVALLGGSALYLAAHIAFRLRNVGTLSVTRPAALVACLALVPVALEVTSLVTLALLCAVLVALITYEVVRFAEARARVRAGHHAAADPA